MILKRKVIYNLYYYFFFHFNYNIFILMFILIIMFQIFAESKDYLSLILFGSSHTNNHLSYKGCYDNIEIVASLGLVTWDLVKHINSLSSADITPSNWLNTLVLAADILKKETEYVY